jgi:hypothetical protein
VKALAIPISEGSIIAAIIKAHIPHTIKKSANCHCHKAFGGIHISDMGK